MRRAGYREAIDWIAGNDDTEWAEYPHGSTDACATPSVTACLVRDLFRVEDAKLRKDVQQRLIAEYRCRATPDGAFDSKPIWRGEYYFDGSWYKVRNGDAQPIAYASEAAALAGAKLMLGIRYETKEDSHG